MAVKRPQPKKVYPELTLDDARKRGWIVEITPTSAIAVRRKKPPHPPITVHSDDPNFSIRVAIAEADGRGFLHGHGLSPDVPCYHRLCCENNPQRPTAPSQRSPEPPPTTSESTTS